jgi:hypothetical protein
MENCAFSCCISLHHKLKLLVVLLFKKAARIHDLQIHNVKEHKGSNSCEETKTDVKKLNHHGSSGRQSACPASPQS